MYAFIPSSKFIYRTYCFVIEYKMSLEGSWVEDLVLRGGVLGK
jgi:hypothetical protein